ncbi:MAG: hypothetical protein QME58_10395 [Bacteroidota bacterium]|nr:hypothetical protein [Bacteroidota bacterium]
MLSTKMDFGIKIISLLSLIFISCNPPVPDSTLRFDFLQNFDKVVKQPSPEKVFKYQKWQKATEGRDAMVIGVFGEAGFTLLPEQTGEHLYFGLRLRIPDSARAECIIVVQTSSQKDTVFRRFMDAAQNINDRNWSDEYVNMSKYKNQHLTVKFSVLYADTDAWMEWSSPILVADE